MNITILPNRISSIITDAILLSRTDFKTKSRLRDDVYKLLDEFYEGNNTRPMFQTYKICLKFFRLERKWEFYNNRTPLTITQAKKYAEHLMAGARPIRQDELFIPIEEEYV